MRLLVGSGTPQHALQACQRGIGMESSERENYYEMRIENPTTRGGSHIMVLSHKHILDSLHISMV